MDILDFLFGKREEPEEAFDMEAWNREHREHYRTMSDEEYTWVKQFDGNLTMALADYTGRGDFRFYGSDTGEHHYYAQSEMLDETNYIVQMNDRGGVSIVEEIPAWEFCTICDDYRPPSHFPHQ